MCKDAFRLGYFKYTDETKVMLLFAVKSFIIVWILTSYTSFVNLLGFDLETLHKNMNFRLNQLLQLSHGSVDIPSDFTCILLSFVSAIISFLVVRINITFSYFFYIFTKSTD